MTKEGLDDILVALADLVDQVEVDGLYEEDQLESHVLYKFKKEEPYTITKDGEGLYTIHGAEIEKLFKMTKFESQEAILRFAKRLRRMGIDDKLEAMGAKSGDKVRILDFEFEFND